MSDKEFERAFVAIDVGMIIIAERVIDLACNF